MFSHNALINDIAILRMASKLNHDNTKSPICLPSYQDEVVVDECYVAGWGAIAYDGIYIFN